MSNHYASLHTLCNENEHVMHVELNNGTRQTSSGYQARINGAVSAGATQIVVSSAQKNS